MQIGDDHGALSALEHAVRLCDGEESSQARLLVGQALSSRGAILHGLGHVDQTRRIAEEIVQRFLDDTEPALRCQAAYALGWLASERLRAGDVAAVAQLRIGLRARAGEPAHELVDAGGGDAHVEVVAQRGLDQAVERRIAELRSVAK